MAKKIKEARGCGMRNRKRFVGVVVFVAVCWLLPLRNVKAQEVVDKMVATINNRELITYTDLLWQVALIPSAPLDNPRADNLNRALQLVVDQRLIAQEAQNLPSAVPSDAEVEAALSELAKEFANPTELLRRAERVGLTAEQLREIVRQRVSIKKYLDFRFREFTVVTPEEIASYYRDVFVPRFRQQTPARIVPTLEAEQAEIKSTLEERKISADINTFLENARAAAEIVLLSEEFELGRGE